MYLHRSKYSEMMKREPETVEDAKKVAAEAAKKLWDAEDVGLSYMRETAAAIALLNAAEVYMDELLKVAGPDVYQFVSGIIEAGQAMVKEGDKLAEFVAWSALQTEARKLIKQDAA